MEERKVKLWLHLFERHLGVIEALTYKWVGCQKCVTVYRITHALYSPSIWSATRVLAEHAHDMISGVNRRG